MIDPATLAHLNFATGGSVDPAIAEAFKALNPTEDQARLLMGYFGDPTGAGARELGEGWDHWRTQDGEERAGPDWANYLASNSGGLEKLQALLQPYEGREVDYTRRVERGAEDSDTEYMDWLDPITGSLHSAPSVLMQQLEGRPDLEWTGTHIGGAEANPEKMLNHMRYGYEQAGDGKMKFLGGSPEAYRYDNGTRDNLIGLLAVLGGVGAGAALGGGAAAGGAGAGAGSSFGVLAPTAGAGTVDLTAAALAGGAGGAAAGGGSSFGVLGPTSGAGTTAINPAALGSGASGFGVQGPLDGPGTTAISPEQLNAAPGGWNGKDAWNAFRTGTSVLNMLNGGQQAAGGQGGAGQGTQSAPTQYSPVPWALGGADTRNRPMYVPGVDEAPPGWDLPRGQGLGLPIKGF